jgi:hypothetical protein
VCILLCEKVKAQLLAPVRFPFLRPITLHNDLKALPEMLNAFAIASGRFREGRKGRVIGIAGALEAPVLLSGQSLVDTIRYLGHRVAK